MEAIVKSIGENDVRPFMTHPEIAGDRAVHIIEDMDGLRGLQAEWNRLSK